jgi:hypothetical protein
MAKRVLRSVDPDALAIALDDAEERGLGLIVPEPEKAPEDCVYLEFAGPAQLELLASRLPTVEVQLRTMGGAGRSKVVRKVFHKAAVLHVLRFVFASDDDFEPMMRALDTVDRKDWKVV